MVSIELLMIVAQICLSPTSSPKDVQESVRCTESITSCSKAKIPKLDAVGFNQCIIDYELARKN